MPGHPRVTETARRVRLGVYIVSGLYVTVGLIFAARYAFIGDVMHTLIGLLIVSGALGGAFALLRALSLAARLWRVAEAIDDVRDRLHELAATNPPSGVDAQAAEAVKLMNLAAMGNGDPTLLSAATLDRSRFPRLVTALDELREHSLGPPDAFDQPYLPTATLGNTPPAPAAPPTVDVSAPDGRPELHPEDANGFGVADRVSTRNLLRHWKVALRNHDLENCRKVFGALVDLADAQVGARLRRDLVEMERQVQHALCRAFQEAIRTGDYAAALTAGDRLRAHFPDSQAARDFTRLEPHLHRRLEARFASTGS